MYPYSTPGEAGNYYYPYFTEERQRDYIICPRTNRKPQAELRTEPISLVSQPSALTRRPSLAGNSNICFLQIRVPVKLTAQLYRMQQKLGSSMADLVSSLEEHHCKNKTKHQSLAFMPFIQWYYTVKVKVSGWQTLKYQHLNVWCYCILNLYYFELGVIYSDNII